jgi:signal transduction histidine kinase
VSRHRPPSLIEAAARFVVAEAMTNIAQHAKASRTAVSVRVDHDLLLIDVDDDGAGRAEFGGSGLVCLRGCVEALGGRLVLDGPPGHGTRHHATRRLPAPR